MTHSFSIPSSHPFMTDHFIPTFLQKQARTANLTLCKHYILPCSLKCQALGFRGGVFEDGGEKRGDCGCPARTENQAVLLALMVQCAFIFCNRWIHFSWFQTSPPLPFSPLVWNNIWFCLPAGWITALVSMPMTFQRGNGFFLPQRVLYCSDFHDLGGGRAGGSMLLSGLLFGHSVK